MQSWMKNTRQLSPRRHGEKPPHLHEHPLAWGTGEVTLRFVSGSELDQPFKDSALDYRSIHKHSLVQGEEIL